jgi:ribose transport system permease protein
LKVKTDSADRETGKTFTIRRILEIQEVTVLIPLVVLVGVVTAINPVFLNPYNLGALARMMAAWGLLAIGETFIILIGEIDISLGSMVSFAVMFFGYLMVELGFSLGLSIVFTLFLTVILSLINGLCIVKLKIHAFITTIAMLNICKGGARVLSFAKPIRVYGTEGTSGFFSFGMAEPFGMSWMFIIFIVLILAGHFVLRKTVYGRKIYATGDSVKVATMAGIRVDRIKISTFVISGLLVGISAIMLVGKQGSSNPNFGQGWELMVIAATAIGGISLAGGSGSMIGTLIGVILFATISNILVLLEVNQHMQSVITGVIMILSVIIDIRRRNRMLGE